MSLRAPHRQHANLGGRWDAGAALGVAVALAIATIGMLVA
jgi:hypothetical protein